MDKISIIIPCFNEEEALPIYYTEMKKSYGHYEETDRFRIDICR